MWSWRPRVPASRMPCSLNPSTAARAPACSLAAQGCIGHLPIQDRSHGAKGAYVEGDNSALQHLAVRTAPKMS